LKIGGLSLGEIMAIAYSAFEVPLLSIFMGIICYILFPYVGINRGVGFAFGAALGFIVAVKGVYERTKNVEELRTEEETLQKYEEYLNSKFEEPSE